MGEGRRVFAVSLSLAVRQAELAATDGLFPTSSIQVDLSNFWRGEEIRGRQPKLAFSLHASLSDPQVILAARRAIPLFKL